MSNILWFSRIFTLQSFRWFCFIFLTVSYVYLKKKDYNESKKFFYNHWIWKFENFQFFSFPFLKFTNFKITTNSFIYSLVEQFFETHFHKNNYWDKGYTFGKNFTKFSGLYTALPGVWGYIIRATVVTLKKSNIKSFLIPILII